MNAIGRCCRRVFSDETVDLEDFSCFYYVTQIDREQTLLLLDADVFTSFFPIKIIVEREFAELTTSSLVA